MVVRFNVLAEKLNKWAVPKALNHDIMARSSTVQLRVSDLISSMPDADHAGNCDGSGEFPRQRCLILRTTRYAAGLRSRPKTKPGLVITAIRKPVRPPNSKLQLGTGHYPPFLSLNFGPA